MRLKFFNPKESRIGLDYYSKFPILSKSCGHVCKDSNQVALHVAQGNLENRGNRSKACIKLKFR